ncbi:MAG: O-antigen ligase family protein [Pirellulaceae bacterium]
MNAIGTEIRSRSAHRGTRRSQRRTSSTHQRAFLAAQIALGVVLTLSPWWYGGVTATVQFWLFAGVFLSSVLYLASQFRKDPAAVPVPTATLPLVLAIGLGVFQLMPIPAPLLRLVTPRNAELWENLTAADVSDGAANRALELGVPDREAVATISMYPASTRRDLAMLILATSVFLLGVTLFSSQRRPVALFAGLAIVGVALAFFGMAQQVSSSRTIFGMSIPGAAPFASFVNRNNAVGFLNLCLAGAIGLSVWAFSRKEKKSDSELAARVLSLPSLRDHRRLRRAAQKFASVATFFADFDGYKLGGLIAIGFITAGVLFAMSRGGWLAAMGAGIAVTLTLGATGRARLGLWIFVLATGSAFFLASWLDRTEPIQQRFDTLQDGQAAKDPRLANWHDGLKATTDFALLGSGLGTWRYVYGLYEDRHVASWYYHAENQYLEALVEGGVLGLGLMLAAIALTAVACRRLLQEPLGSTSYACGVAGLFALVSQSIHACFDFGLYLTANMAVFAAICGIVAGRAASVVREHRAAQEHRSYRFHFRDLLFSISHVPSVVPICLALLTGGIVWGTLEKRAAAAAESALAKMPLPKPGEQAAASKLSSGIAALQRASDACPDDALVHRRLAKLWIQRYRSSSFEMLIEEKNALDEWSEKTKIALDKRSEEARERSEETLWELTSPPQLYAWVRQLERESRTVELDDFRSAPGTTMDLSRAVRHLLRARNACPLLPDVHVLLAELEPVVTPHGNGALHLERARRLAGSNPDLLAECGLIGLQAGRIDEAIEDWRLCIEQDTKRLGPFLNIAIRLPEFESRLAAVMPDSPSVLIEAVGELDGEASHDRVRETLLAKAEAGLEAEDLPVDERHYLRGRIRDLQQRPRDAIEHYALAIELSPRKTEWRYELATLLHSTGQLELARKHAARCWRANPKSRRYTKLLKQIIQAQIRKPRRATP